MPKTAEQIATAVIDKMVESDKVLGLNKKAYDYIDQPTQEALLRHNKEQFSQAGTTLGLGLGGLGGGGLGAGIGALLSGAGRRWRGAGTGGLAGGLLGGALGGLVGPGLGESQADEATAKDLERLNQLAQMRISEGGMGFCLCLL